MNASMTQLRQSDYIEAAIAMGASGPRLIRKHFLPNAISPTMVLMARDVGGMVVLAAAFIFIGFGGDIAWGIILVSSRDFVIGLGGNPFVYWWSFLPFALALTLFALGWNLLGDGLNSALNPRRSRFK
jgi:peptide/nickel transport system permease protein